MNTENHSNDYQQKPVYKIAYEIVKTTKAIIESIDEQRDSMNLRSLMLQNAMTIPAKIAGAEAVDVFSIKIENAVLIKISARELQSYVALCKQLNLNNPKYLNILEMEIDDFRQVFNNWVSSFEPEVDIDDGWRLFPKNDY
jgi:hypothetical protein